MSEALRPRLEADLKDAMKSGDTVAKETIRFTLAALKNLEIDNRAGITPADELALLQRQVKRQQESIDQFRAAGREDLVNIELAQLAILKRYLPEEMSDGDLAALVRDAVAETGATGPKEMGKVMPVAIAKAAGRADGKRLSAAVKAALS